LGGVVEVKYTLLCRVWRNITKTARLLAVAYRYYVYVPGVSVDTYRKTVHAQPPHVSEKKTQSRWFVSRNTLCMISASGALERKHSLQSAWLLSE
jgi:hypothetical protein